MRMMGKKGWMRQPIHFPNKAKTYKRSMGSGKMIVEFFSAEIELRVCNQRVVVALPCISSIEMDKNKLA